MYTEAFDRLIAILPVPIVAIIASLVFGTWFIKEYKSLPSYGHVFKSKAFKMFLITESFLVVLLLALVGISRIITAHTVDSGKLGIVVSTIAGSSGQNYETAIVNHLKNIMRNVPDYSDVVITTTDEEVETPLKAVGVLEKYNGKILVTGYCEGKTVVMSVYHLRGMSPLVVPVPDFPNLSDLNKMIFSLVEDYIRNDLRVRRLEAENTRLRKMNDSLLFLNQNPKALTAWSDSDSELLKNIKGAFKERKKVIVSIGINEVANLKYSSLRYAESDARKVSEFFRNTPNTEVVEIIGPQATNANIRKTLTDLALNLGPTDLLITYFSGHGIEIKEQFYFLPYDYRQGEETSTAISGFEMAQFLKNANSKFKAIVLDACYSGGIRSNTRGVEITKNVKNFFRGSTVVLSASNELAYDLHDGGAYTFAFLEALAGKADLDNDHIITAPEAHFYCSQSLLQTGLRQVPVINILDGYGDLVLNVVEEPTLSINLPDSVFR